MMFEGTDGAMIVGESFWLINLKHLTEKNKKIQWNKILSLSSIKYGWG